MKIVVLGGGIIGVSTAFFLTQEGHEVTVIDRQPGVGLETSYANGGQIAVSHAEPWANPSVIGKALRWLGKKNAPLLFHARLDPGLWAWIFRFLRNCTPARTRINTERTLRIAEYSRSILRQVREQTGIEYEQKTKGILHVYRNPREFEGALHAADIMKSFGFDRRPFTPRECVELDSAFSSVEGDLVGALYSPDDESGDAHIFTTALADICRNNGVEFKFNSQIQALTKVGGRITGVETNMGQVKGDKFVVCMGSYSPLLLKPLGLNLPIYPAKGYSVTIPVGNHLGAPQVSLTDDEFKLVYSRLGNRLRVAGTAEFNGYNTDLHTGREKHILKLAMEMFPDCGDENGVEYWTGLRPKTPDSVPIISGPLFQNLYLNTGHGTLGWTMSCGSGKAISDLISGKKTDISLDGLGQARF